VLRDITRSLVGRSIHLSGIRRITTFGSSISNGGPGVPWARHNPDLRPRRVWAQDCWCALAWWHTRQSRVSQARLVLVVSGQCDPRGIATKSSKQSARMNGGIRQAVADTWRKSTTCR